MDRITLHDKTFRRYIDNGRIEEAIDLVAEKLNRDYADVARPVMLLSVMNGALMFTGELLKRLNFPLELISIKLRSYSGTGSTGKVVTTMGLTGDVSGRDVLIVEDCFSSLMPFLSMTRWIMSAWKAPRISLSVSALIMMNSDAIIRTFTSWTSNAPKPYLR